MAFRLSQQPVPLIGFENPSSENQVGTQFVGSEFKGRNEYFIDVQAAIIYGFTDNLSIYINYPNAVRFRQGDKHSSGPEDTVLQFEYAPYTEEYYTYYNQISIVANVTIPTVRLKKRRTGTGSNSFFVGGIFTHVGIDWYYFTSHGGIFNATSHRTKAGDQFLYQFGLGRRIFSNKDWLFDWLIELDGQYAGKDRVDGNTDPNSGGNIIYVTPSLFLASSQSLVVQLGMGFPISQNLNGDQNRKEYLLQTKISWNF